MPKPPAPLAGKVALVAGATRGAGRGIAAMLGEAGATVYCSGRSVKGRPATPGRAETIEETAALVDRFGGKGVAFRCDHTVESDVEQLVSRIQAKHGKLDVLVNDVWGGDALVEWGKPFWEIPVHSVRVLMERAVFSHVLTAQKAAPLLLSAAKSEGRALVVEITDGDSYIYRGHLLYDLVKTSVIRLAYAFSEEFAGTGVSSVAVTPGFLRSEAMLQHFGVTESNWRDAGRKDPNFLHSESPFFVGRAVAALAGDPDLGRRNGRVFGSWTLAKEYGFTDMDGSRPDIGEEFRRKYGLFRPLDDAFYGYWSGWQGLKKML